MLDNLQISNYKIPYQMFTKYKHKIRTPVMPVLQKVDEKPGTVFRNQ